MRVCAVVIFAGFLLESAALASALDVEVTTNDGARWRGTLVDVAPDLIIDAAADQIVLDWSEVFELRPLIAAPASAPHADASPVRIMLVDGSRFGARLESAAAGELGVRFRSGLAAAIRTSLIQEIRLRHASVEANRALDAVAADSERTEDFVVVEREGRMLELRGAVRLLSADGVRFFWRQRERDLPWAVVAGVVFPPRGVRSSSTTVVLRDGDRFKGRIRGGDQNALLLHTLVADPLAVAWERVLRVENRSERVVFLSDLRPEGYEFEPMFSKRWEVRFDRTLLGRAPRLAGVPYEKAVCMHSRSRLTYDIGQQFRQFAAIVGVSDEMGDRGDAAVKVVGDGQVLWESPSVRGNQPPQELLVDVTGVRRLTLVVDYGADLDLSDHVIWALPRVMR